MSETYLILCVDPVTQERALTNPPPHTLTSPLHSLLSPSQADLCLHSQGRLAAAFWRALSIVLTKPGDRWDEVGVKQNTTDAQDECNCNHQMFPTPTETRCCSPDGKEEVGSARSRSCSHSKLLYLQQNSTHISIAVICVELAQQQFCREPLTHEVGDSVAVITIEDTIEVAVVLTPAKRA